MTPDRLKELRGMVAFTRSMSAPSVSYGPHPPLTPDEFDALLTAAEDAARYRAALERIRTGKLQEDNEHPLGEWASMGMRFHRIAIDAIAPRGPGQTTETTR